MKESGFYAQVNSCATCRRSFDRTLQSRSVVGLIVLAFVGLEVISLSSGVAIVFGSNLGTTVTGGRPDQAPEAQSPYADETPNARKQSFH